ncbi:MAG TPA: PDR/VanB family oxidoreductase [Pseudonocardiaceae bacterium]|jgi:ferredoxin-NADP reductase|nr:PDR/VanB family oxidoreductase [Pseudonocardiaceae bacterium]
MDLELVVHSRELLAAGVVGLTLRPVDGGPLPEWQPGAHVELVLGPGLERQYSLCGDPADRAGWRIAVLREPAGRGGSAFVHDRLAAGDRVRVRGPRNHFALVAAPRYLFVVGGIGITPIRPMLAALAATGADWRLLYGGRTRASMAFRSELAERYGDRVRVWPQDEHGLLDLDAVAGFPGAVYCCGPEPLLAAVEQRCPAAHVERFTARPDERPTDAFEVELARAGPTVRVPADRSILSVVEEAGVAVLSSCQEGTCGTCETTVLAGVPDHRDSLLTEDERAAGDTMMICVSRSRTPRLVLDI